MNQYRVVYVEPGKPAVEKKIGTKLEDLQAEVGGLIECIYCHRDGTLIVANDEAKLLGMEGNRRLDGGSIIAGPFFVIGDAGENFRSLTDAEVNRYLQVYAEPQQISQREVQADIRWRITPDGNGRWFPTPVSSVSPGGSGQPAACTRWRW